MNDKYMKNHIEGFMVYDEECDSSLNTVYQLETDPELLNDMFWQSGEIHKVTIIIGDTVE